MPGLLQSSYPTGRLTVSSTSLGFLSLHTHAWNAPDLAPLWTSLARRGRNRLLPTAAGVIPYRRRTTEIDVLLDFAVCGEVDKSGTYYADPWVGLQANLEELHDQIFADPATTAGTRNTRLTMPSGVDRTGNIHWLRLEHRQTLEGENTETGDHGVIWLGSIALSIPDSTAFVT